MHLDRVNNPYIERVKALLRSRDPKVRDMVQRAGEDILNMKNLSPSQVHTDATLSGISVQYQNQEYIGLKLMPVVQIPTIGGKYFKYSKRDRLAAPDDHVGTRSTPNEISETRTTASVATEPYALVDFIDDRTLRAADSPLNEMVDLVGAVNEAIALKEEQRIAAILTSTTVFSGSTAAIAAADRWDTALGGDPIGTIQNGADGLWSGPGATRRVMWSGPAVFRALSRHPQVLDVMKYTQKGFATQDMLAQLFGVDEYLVGYARQDIANIGQTANYTRIWGTDSLGIGSVATTPGTRTACIGFTFRFGPKQTTQWFEPMPGISGGYYAKVGVDEQHVAVAVDTGYLWTTVIG